MGSDMAVELMRNMLKEALIVSAPVLIAAGLISFVLSLFQTLTSLQDQTITTVPRLLIVGVVMLIALPWFARRLVTYTVVLFSGFHHYVS